MRNIKVCLAWHNLDSSNFGVGALAIANITLLLRAAEESGVTLTIDTFGTKMVKGLKVKNELESRLGVKIGHIDYSFKDFLLCILKFDFKYFKKISGYDIVIDIGEGDSFTDIYGMKRYLSQMSTKVLALLCKKKLVLAPQTIGPFKSKFNLFFAKKVIDKSLLVFSRDYKTSKFLTDINSSFITVSDVAFKLPYDEVKTINDTVGLNISGLLWNGGYSGDNQFDLKVDYIAFVKDVIDGFKSRGKKIHLVGHVISDDIPVEDDYRVCQKIKEMYSSDNDVILAPKFATPIEAKSYINQLDFFVGSRMHATIAAISSGVRCVPIAYSRKFSGVFGALGYNYTLDAYSLSNRELAETLFNYYDHDFDKMLLTVEQAKLKAFELNEQYVEKIKELFLHENN